MTATSIDGLSIHTEHGVFGTVLGKDEKPQQTDKDGRDLKKSRSSADGGTKEDEKG